MLWSSSSIVPVANSLFALVGGRISASLRFNMETMDAMVAGYSLSIWIWRRRRYLQKIAADCRLPTATVRRTLASLCTANIPKIRDFICSSVCRLFLTGCWTLVCWARLV